MTNITIKIGDMITLKDSFDYTAEIYVKADFSALVRYRGGNLDGRETRFAGARHALHHVTDLGYKVIEHKTV